MSHLRRTLVPAVAVLAVAAAPAAHAQEATAFCESETGADGRTSSVVTMSDERPDVGEAVTFSAPVNGQYYKQGSLVFTVKLPSGSEVELRPENPAHFAHPYRFQRSGDHAVYARWEYRSCDAPVQYGTAYASTGAFKVGDGQADPTTAGDEGSNFTEVAASRVAAATGALAPVIVPSGCGGATILHGALLGIAEWPKKEPRGIRVNYHGSRDPKCPILWSGRASLARVRDIVAERLRDHRRLGGTGTSRRFTAGHFTGTEFKLHTRRPRTDRVYYVWSAGTRTYVFTAPTAGKIGTRTLKAMIASFKGE